MDLRPYRERIDVLDDEIVRLFAQRMEIVEEMMRLKREAGVAPEDSGREAEVVERLSSQVPASLRPAVARLNGNSSYLWRN